MVEKKKEVKYDVQIRYRDGGVDKYRGVKSAAAVDNVLEIVESSGVFVGIVLDIVSYYNVEEA